LNHKATVDEWKKLMNVGGSMPDKSDAIHVQAVLEHLATYGSEAEKGETKPDTIQ